jgi:thioredoxin-related protein
LQKTRRRRADLVTLATTALLAESVDMKLLKRSSITFIALLMTAVVTTGADSAWLTDFQKAQDQAKADKKLVLLDFTGSDWCGWCIRLKREVFSQDEFKDYASKNLVLVEVDFPRAKPQSGSLREQNEQLAGRFGIQGFPTIVVLDGEGKKVGELGYTPGGPSAFIAELEKLKKS